MNQPNSKKPEDVWDKIMRDQQVIRRMAENVKRLWKTMDKLPQEELVKLFQAICAAGEEYDPQMRYRRKILGLLHEEQLPNLIGLRLPVALAWEFEKRFWVVERELPDPPWPGNVDIEEVPDE
jgi:hypothetical protein